MSKTWELECLLPNCQPDRAIESDFVAIVPHNDSRFQTAANRHCAARKLIDSFTNQFGKKVEPSALLVRSNRPTTIDFYAYASFRNLVALSCIIRGWTYQDPTGSQSNPNLIWTDHFDFYPFTTEDGKSLSGSSGAIISLNPTPCMFCGQSAPHLTVDNIPFCCDEYVLDECLKRWRQQFEQGKEDQNTRKLFRSLEMAFHAGRVPGVGTREPTIHDAGVNIALWVSALETLCHPGRKRVNQKKVKVDLEKVVNFLGTVSYYERSLNAKWYTLTWRRKKLRTNFAGRLYNELYDARNRFLHGEKVRRSRLFPYRQPDRMTLLQCAPLIYRAALMAFFGYKLPNTGGGSVASTQASAAKREQSTTPCDEMVIAAEQVELSMPHDRYEKALKCCRLACRKKRKSQQTK